MACDDDDDDENVVSGRKINASFFSVSRINTGQEDEEHAPHLAFEEIQFLDQLPVTPREECEDGWRRQDFFY